MKSLATYAAPDRTGAHRMTTQDAFHPMRGHVRDGQVIHMNNGDTCTLRAVMKGWQLFDQQGRPHSIPTDSAHVIACLVTVYPSNETHV